MVAIRSLNEIILSLVDFYRVTLPEADTKPGTAVRDLFIEGPASQLALLYEELSGVSDKQSIRLVVGSDLDKLAKNYGLTRKQSTASSGVALLTFSSIQTNININPGSTITANNGYTFAVSAGTVIQPSASNFYKSVASKFRDQLDTIGITDQYAVEVTVTATFPGSAGNIGQYSLNRTGITGVSNVTNIFAFNGGTDQESDISFRTRILSSFSGSSIGTALGYLNTALSIAGVNDAYVIQPGDPLMTRDGTTVTSNPDGSNTIVSEGSGGKVDISILGSSLAQNSDSYIYQDKSNNNDPTDVRNNIVLGQIAADANKTINRKRIDDIAAGTLPAQPVNTIVSISGSLSGSNFIQKTTDVYGRTSGNYELIKDSGAYAGSAWGFDTLHWINDRINDFTEDRIKGQSNSQDATSFTGVTKISSVQQNVAITNENSIVSSDRSIIQLLHYPSANVTRVFNTNTGERYLIIDQNVDKTSPYNSTGRIKISGNTLPAPSDILQVDYTWIVTYDNYSDFDGLVNTNNYRPVTDSIDWGYSSLIRNEKIVFNLDVSGNFFTGSSSENISSIVFANKITEIDGYVEQISSGIFAGRLSVVLKNLPIQTSSIYSLKLKNSNAELYNTSQNDGSISNAAVVVGVDIVYYTTIILPSDTSAKINDKITSIINTSNVFSNNVNAGSFVNNNITIPASLVNTSATKINLLVSYISNVNSMFSGTISGALSSSKIGNGFINSTTGFTNNSIVNLTRREFSSVGASNIVNIVIPNNTSISRIISIIRLSDGLELWNSDNEGSFVAGAITLSGYNTPVLNDTVLVIYYANDLQNNQPLSYYNSVIRSRVDTLSLASSKHYVNLNKITTDALPVRFQVFEPNTNIVLFSGTDGYVTSLGSTATFTSVSAVFSNAHDILNKKLRIYNSSYVNNDGYFDLLNYNAGTNTLTITNEYNHIKPEQVCIIRVLDNKELWNSNCTIDLVNNKLILDNVTSANTGDLVYVITYNYNNLRLSPTKVSSTISGQTINTGTLSVNGTTLSKATNIVFTAANNGLKQNLIEAIRKYLNISSTTSIPSTIKLVNILKLEKVNTLSNTNDEVLNIVNGYDVKNSTINNNLYYNNMLSDASFNSLEFSIPNTFNNSSNKPSVGDKLRVTFYFITENDSENLSYTRNGVLYTNKKFAMINKIYTSSGFNSSSGTALNMLSFTQPTTGSRYKSSYDYLAPKKNERIVIQSSYNKLIADATFNIEKNRPINADVLVKESNKVAVDVIMNIVISSDYINSSATVVQNVKNQIISALTPNKLGTLVDNITLVNKAQNIAGVTRARLIYMNKTGKQGTVNSIQAQNNEYIISNNITINTETL